MYPSVRCECYNYVITRRKLGEGDKMRRVGLVTVVILLCIIVSPVAARSVFDIGLRSATLYNAECAMNEDGFFQDLSEGKNWTIGLGFDMRLSAFHLSVLASSQHDTEEGVDVFTGFSFDIPLVNDFLYLNAGAGVTTGIVFSESEDAQPRYNNIENSGRYGLPEVLGSSPIHLKAGFDIVIGPSTLSLFYMRQTDHLVEDGLFGSFTSDGEHLVGVAMNLSVL